MFANHKAFTRAYIAIYAAVALSSCSSPGAADEVTPATCIAVFNYALNQARGTALEHDPQIEEMKIRIMYEQSEANKSDSIARIEERVQELARSIPADRQAALKTAGHCLTNEEMGDDYRKQRPQIIRMMEDRHNHL